MTKETVMLQPQDCILTYNNPISWLETVWIALDEQQDLMPDEQWDDVCTAMSWLAESLGIEYDTNGEFVYVSK